MPKILIFDFDGTIADSFETLLTVFEEITNRPQKLTAAEVAELRGSSLRQIINYLGIKRWQIPRLVIKAKHKISLKISEIESFKGIPEVLKLLDSKDGQIFILSTNSSNNISRFLKANHLDQYFDGIYGDIGLRSKSSALKKIIRKEKLSPNDCVYIGDEVRDIEAAKKAKVKSIAVSWGFNSPAVLRQVQPDYLAKAPKDLAKHLTC